MIRVANTMQACLRTLLERFGVLDLARRCWCAALAKAKGLHVAREADVIRICRDQKEIHIGRHHEVYLRDMIVFFDYYFSAVVPDRNGDRCICDYSKPKVHRLQRSLVEFEFPSLPESDESTEIYLSALQPKPGEAVLDLGSYAGASAYFFAKAVGPLGVVGAFEPDLTNLECLRANVRRHALENVKIFDCGIWSETKTVAFQSEGNMGSSISTIANRRSNVQEVRMVTLEEATRLCGLQSVACIKMDIEGAEVEVLKSAHEFLRRHRPRLVVEPHLVDGTMTTEQVTEILEKAGYTVETLSQGSNDWPLLSCRPAIAS